jgi:ATP-dependent DNA helicase PIF1
MADDYKLLKEYVLNGFNIFLTGPGGSGKSTLINQLRKEFDIMLTSTTGVSAYNFQGRTIHSFSGIGAVKHSDKIPSIIKKVGKNKPAVKRILECKILVIDEISMLGKYYLEVLDEIFRHFRKDENIFGGIQVIFTGDFLQLPPINDEFCFMSTVWENLSLKTIKLEKLYRFTDKKYSEILSRVRICEHTADDNKELFKRVFAYRDLEEKESKLEITPTYLYGKKMNVHDKNMEELDKNPNKQFVCFGKTVCNLPEMENIIDTIIPKFLHFKVGAQVMLTVNLDVENGLVNGSRGVIVDMVGSDKNCETIVVKFLDGRILPFSKHIFKYEEDEKLIYEREQFPFILAYAMSIHKVQGCTLDYAVIDLGYSIFEDSMAYVALSRVKSLDGLFLKSYKPEKITVNKKVIDFYKTL